MKRIFGILLSFFLLFACNKTEFNTPAFLGKKEGERWKATSYSANIDSKGVLRVTGTSGSERVTLVMPNTTIATYDLKEKTAEGQVTLDTISYSTKNVADPDVTLYPADGIIELSNFDEVNKTVTGVFHFNAFSIDGKKAINFSEGNFYKVPITDATIIDPSGGSCESAVQLVVVALEKYKKVIGSPGTDEYKQACEEYKAALTKQKESCGDEEGTIQAQIDSLGDCSGGGTGGNEEDDFYAEIDGVEFKEEKVKGIILGSKNIVITATIGQTEIINVSFPTDIKVGQYTVDDIPDQYALWQINKGGKKLVVSPKTLKFTIIEHDTDKKMIKGTFEFDAYDADAPDEIIKVTKGTFTVTYK